MLNVTIKNGELNGELNSSISNLSKNELEVYYLIEKVPQNSRQKIANQLNMSTRTVDRVINSLIQKNLIQREGSKKTGYWKTISNEENKQLNDNI